MVLTVWDTQNSRPLLSCRGVWDPLGVSFSSDGSLLACPTERSEICLWKESPTGYIIQGVFPCSSDPHPVLSPNSKLIVVLENHLVQSWQIKSFTATLSGIPTPGPRNTRNFAIDFSPDGTLVVFARLGDHIVTVLDLKSGDPKLTINTSMKVYGLKIARNTVGVVGVEKVITWNLPVGDYTPGTMVAIKDSVQIVNLSPHEDSMCAASISPDFHHIAITAYDDWSETHLGICSASTGKPLGWTKSSSGNEQITADMSWFTPDGLKVWHADLSGKSEVWRIISDRGPDLITLECEETIVDPQYPPEGYPWGSSCCYQATNNGWVLGQDGECLLMLPPPWQSDVVRRVWNEQYLALLHGGLSEPVILELEP